jgi:hypothetical protein
MTPHQTFTRIPMQVGSELHIKNNGEISVDNPTVETALGAADGILEYRFDFQTGEHVIRLVEPVVPGRAKRR